MTESSKNRKDNQSKTDSEIQLSQGKRLGKMKSNRDNAMNRSPSSLAMLIFGAQWKLVPN
jgi:hypothetical protein